MHDAADNSNDARLPRPEVWTALSLWGRLAGQCQNLGPDPWDLTRHVDQATGELVGVTAVLRSRRCGVVWRGPITDVQHSATALADLIDDARRHRSQLYVLGADPWLRAAADELGARALWVGHECYVDVQGWSLAGGRRSKIRWARNHAARTCTWRMTHPLEQAADREQMLAVEAAWKAERRERMTDSFLRTALLETAALRKYAVCERLGEIIAYAVASPLNASSWYLQDLVRLPGSPRGALEGAVALLLDVLRDEGAVELSNGILPFWSPEGAVTPMQRPGVIARRAIAFFDRRYRFSGINQFRLKLEPDRVEPVCVLIWPRRLQVRSVWSLARLLT